MTPTRLSTTWMRINSRVVWHAAFWVLQSVNELLIAAVERRSALTVLRDVVEVHAVLAVPAYVNLLLLVPHLFARRRHLTYALSLLTVATLSATFYVSALYDHLVLNTSSAPSLVRWTFTCLLYTFMVLALDKAVLHGRALRREAETRRLHAERRVEQLSAQLNPHFLFNTLNNLYALAVAQSPLLPDLLLQHAGLLRHSLDQARMDRVSLVSEIDFLIAYIELERVRLDKSLDIQFDVTGIVRDQQIPPMLLAPLLENCFKHLASDERGIARIHGLLAVSDNTMCFSLSNSCAQGVSDNGRVVSGIGLTNTRERLAILYPNRHSLDARMRSGEFVTELRLQL